MNIRSTSVAFLISISIGLTGSCFAASAVGAASDSSAASASSWSSVAPDSDSGSGSGSDSDSGASHSSISADYPSEASHISEPPLERRWADIYESLVKDKRINCSSSCAPGYIEPIVQRYLQEYEDENPHHAKERTALCHGAYALFGVDKVQTDIRLRCLAFLMFFITNNGILDQSYASTYSYVVASFLDFAEATLIEKCNEKEDLSAIDNFAEPFCIEVAKIFAAVKRNKRFVRSLTNIHAGDLRSEFKRDLRKAVDTGEYKNIYDCIEKAICFPPRQKTARKKTAAPAAAAVSKPAPTGVKRPEPSSREEEQPGVQTKRVACVARVKAEKNLTMLRSLMMFAEGVLTGGAQDKSPEETMRHLFGVCAQFLHNKGVDKQLRYIFDLCANRVVCSLPPAKSDDALFVKPLNAIKVACFTAETIWVARDKSPLAGRAVFLLIPFIARNIGVYALDDENKIIGCLQNIATGFTRVREVLARTMDDSAMKNLCNALEYSKKDVDLKKQRDLVFRQSKTGALRRALFRNYLHLVMYVMRDAWRNTQSLDAVMDTLIEVLPLVTKCYAEHKLAELIIKREEDDTKYLASLYEEF